VVFFLEIQGEIVKDGERYFALIPKIMQEMVTDGPRAPLVGRVGNTILLGKVIQEAVSMGLLLYPRQRSFIITF
jgi:hypothetical protein